VQDVLAVADGWRQHEGPQEPDELGAAQRSLLQRRSEMLESDREGPQLWSGRPHGERQIYTNKWVNLCLVDVQQPDGRRWEYHVVRLRHLVLLRASSWRVGGCGFRRWGGLVENVMR
jgi:hypothetical protein